MTALLRYLAIPLCLLLGGTSFTFAQTAADGPVYKPPLRGAPASRIGGGTRGAAQDVPTLAVLAPDHAGWTSNPQPTLYWYLSKPVPVQIELTLLDERGTEPLIEKSLPAPAASGIQALPLKDLGVTLKPEQEYRWHVALVLDPKHRSSDMIASGTIRLMPASDALKAKLAQRGDSDQPAVYAEEGYWYDTVESLMRLMRASPGDTRLRSQLASLLKQVGLAHVAQTQ